MPTIPAYTFNGLTRPALHTDPAGNIILDPVAASFAATYGLKALYLGVPASTPYPPIPAFLTAPSDSNGSANSVVEGAANGTTVGITASSTNNYGAPVSYSLTADSSNGGFAINPTTGVVTVADPAKVNFETNPAHTYTVTVQANDGILTNSRSFTIGVSDVAPTTPVDTNAAANSVAEGAANGTEVGITASSTDVNGPAVTWTLSTDSSGGGFKIDANGVITVADSSKIDYESAAGHAYTVTAQASDGTLTSSQMFTIGVSDIPVSTPSDVDAAVNSVAEGAAVGTAVGVTASAIDPNGPASTYTLTGDTSGGGFTIDSSTGVVTVADPSRIDFETAPGHAYTVTAQATNGVFTRSQAFTITVTDVAPSTPTDANTAAANIVAEGAANGTAVGITVSSTDINGPPPTYSLTDSAGGRFTIDSTTGIVTVANGAAIDFETATGHAYSITAQASDGTLTNSQTFTIGVSDVAPSTPTDGNNAANTVAEGAGVGTVVGVTAASTDVNGPAVIYSFADIGGGVLGDAGGRFQIDSATGEVRVSAFGASNIDYESAAGHAYSVTVQASVGPLTSTPQTFTIAVTNVAPSTPADGDALNPNGVTEGAASGAYTGLTAASADTNSGTVTYSLVDSAGGRFTIDSGTGAVSIGNAGLIDFESSGGSYNITVAASDGTDATSQVFAIAVANTAPSIPTDADAGTADVVTEGAASGVYIGLTATSTDINGPAVTWTLTDDAGGRFAIDPTSGAVSTGPNANLIDFETSGGTSAVNGSYSITAQASDGAGGTRSQTFAIAVADAPPASWSDEDGGANTILEGTANGTQVGVIAHAVDPNGGTVTYSLAVNPNGAFAIDASSGIITVADSTKIDFESTAGHQYTLTVQGTDASGHFTTNDFVVDVTDTAPSAPTDTDTAPGVIAEGAAQSSTVGITAHSLDINGAAVTYSLSNDAGGLFTIDPTTGVVSVTAAGAAGIDYEGTVAAGHTYAITVEASDGTLSSSQNFTIGVTNAAPSQPTDSNGAAGGSIQANAADNTPVGITLASTDPGGGAVTYSITDPSGAFAVDLNTGVVTLKAGHPALAPGTSYTITAVASDGLTQSAAQTFNILASNNALNVDLDNSDIVLGNGYAATFTEGSPVAITDTDDVITNTGSPGVTNATSATIVLTNAQAGDSLLINGLLPGGISQTTTTGSGQITITLSGTASYANYQAALHQIQFSNSGDSPNTTPRTINVTVTDSTGSSPVAVSTITVTSVNDAPALNGAAGAVSFTENAALPTALFAAGTVTDPDAPANFAGGSYTVQITGNPSAGDQIVLLGSSGFSAVGTSIVFGGSTIGTVHAGTGLGTSIVTIDLNSSATPAVVSALAHAFGFQNSSDNPSTANRTVSFTFNDGNNSHTDLASTAQNSNVVTQTVQVIAVNDAPAAQNGSASGNEDNAITGTAAATDVDGPGLTYILVGSNGGAAHGTVTFTNAATGAYTYTPAANFNGTDTFTYKVNDGSLDSNNATITVSVSPANDAPTAADDTIFDIAEDSGARTIAFATLTGNDIAGPANEAGQTLAVATVLNAVGGTVQIIGGNVIFTPTADFTGVASFDYTVQDNGTTNGAADPKTSAAAGHVTFNVTAVNDAPVTVADALAPVAEDSGIRTILFTEFTGNDNPGPANESTQSLVVIGVSNAVGGTVDIVNGHVEFTPTANFNGTASFDYTVRDNGLTNGLVDLKTSVGHASFDVTEVNDAPVAVDDTLSAIATSAAPSARIITFAELTGNDSAGPANEAAQTLTVSAVANPLNGTVVINNGHVEFTPDAGFTGTAEFDYTVTDDGTTTGASSPQSTTGHVTFQVAAIALDLDANDSAATGNNYAVLVTSLATPIAIADVDTIIIDPTSTTLNSATITITTGFVSGGEDSLSFTNDGSSMGDIVAAFDDTTGVLALSSALGASAAQWQAALHAVTYLDTKATPTSTADRTITVVVGDGAVTSNTAITTVHFDANDAPAAGDDTLSAVAEDSSLRTIQFAELTANDSSGPANESGQTLTVIGVSNAVGGTVGFFGGHVEFTPEADFNGTASFDYTVQDNGTTLGNPDAKTDVGHVSFTVTAVNDAPTVAADSLASVAEDSGIAIIAFSDLTGNDSAGPTDEAGQALTVTAVGNAVGGTVAIVNGHVEFTPSANFNGAASFDYTVQDNGTTNGASDPKTAVGHATIAVTEVNDVPVALADTLTAVVEDSGIDIIQFTELTANDNAGPANESTQTLTVTAVSNAVGGTVEIVNGHVEFTPAANFNGTASFDYTVADNGTSAGAPDARTALGHATIAVSAVNDAPVLDLDSTDSAGNKDFTAAYTISATPVAIAPATVSITDVDDSNVTSATVTLTNAQTNDVLAISGALPGGISAVITPGAGTITVSLSGSATLAQYQAALHQIVFSNGSASPDSTALDRVVTVVVDDGHGLAGNTATTTIHLTQDTPPVANVKAASATEAGGLNNSGGSNGSGNVITDAVANSDAENPVSALVVSAFAHGANPGTLGSSLAGDFGTLTLNADGSYSYAVNNANTTVQELRVSTDLLTDTFNYTIRDTAGLTTSSTLTITIHGANDNPVAVSEISTAIEAGTSAGLNPTGNVLTNDTDVDIGDSKVVQGVAAGTQLGPVSSGVGGAGVAGSFGTLTIAADGTYSYVVNNANTSVQALRTSAQTLTDTFSYTMHDAANATSTAQVTITIQGQNDAPVANADTATVTEAGGTNNGTAGTNISNFNVLTGVGAGSVADTDPDSAANGETQTVQGVETGTHLGDVVTSGVGTPLAGSFGTLTLNSNGSYSYTVDNGNATVNALNTGSHVNDVFTYTAHDAAGVTSTTTLNIQVNGANDAPVGVADSAVVFQGRATTPGVNLLANDTDVDTAHTNLTAVKDTNPAHGTVTVNTDGSFTYTGNAGYLGADSFTYHVADNGSPNLSSASITVTLDVQPLVWHIDNTAPAAGEDGSAAHPWHSIAAFNAANAAAGGSSVPDIVYLHNGTGTYTEADGFNLKNGQTLLGQGVDLTYQTSASAPGGAHVVTLFDGDNSQVPTIVVTAGDGIDLAQNNTVQGLHIGNASGVGISDGGGTVGTLNISGVDINTTGQAIDIDQGGTLNVSLNSVTSSGGAQGIQLGGAWSGSFSAGSGTLSGHSAAEVDINGGTGTFNYGGTIGNGSGLSALIANHTGGTVTLSGSITDSNDAAGGIALTNNTGATINFTGGMTLNTGASDAFSATGGGTVNVTGTNHLTATGGTALNISNTTIGASNVTFHDISANGGTNGIVLNNTGTSGHLAVTGNGSVAQGGDSSGGTIQNTTGAGISLTSTLSPTLNNMNIQSTSGSGISGTDVTNFSFTNGTINNSGIIAHGVDTSNIAFNSSPAGATNNVDGTITITNNVLSNGYYHGVDIQNRAGTIDNATISNNAITSATSQTNSQGTGIHIVTFGTAGSSANLTKATIDGNTIANFPIGAGISVQGGNSNAGGPGGTMGVPNNATNIIAITNNNIHGLNTATPIGSEGIVASVQGGNSGSRSQGNFNISGNTITDTKGQGIAMSDFGNATVNAKVNNNTVDTNNIGKNIGSAGIGIGTGVVGTNTSATPLMTVEVIGNTVTDYDGHGILLVALDTNGTLNATVQNNAVGRAAGGGFPSRIRVDSGNENNPGNNTINLDISGNTGFGSSVAGDAPGIGIRLGDGGAATNILRIEGFAGGNDVAVQNYIAGKNPGMFAGTLGGAYSPAKIAEAIHGSNFGGTPSVPQPLLAIAGGVQAASPTPGETHLTQAQLDSVVAAAIAQWAHAGASAAQLAALAAITFSVADLAGNTVGVQTAGHIVVDVDAAGHGWFVDPTPSDNSEFTHAANAAGTKLLTDPTNAAAGHLDLLTTVTHEMGHELGLPDLTAASDVNELMYIDLVDGERRLPDAGDVPATSIWAANAPVVIGTPGNDTIDAGHGGKILVGGAGADSFVFANVDIHATTPWSFLSALWGAPPATPPALTHVADYSFAQGDSFDFSALTSAFHGSSASDAQIVRAVEDPSGTFATLQVNANGPSIASWFNMLLQGNFNGPSNSTASWVDVARLDGAHAGDEVSVRIDSHAVHLATIHVGLLV